MVSWGTTANCSFPTVEAVVPQGWRSSEYVDGRLLAEAGLSAAGSAMRWLSEQVGTPVEQLQTLAATSPPGANGVICLPWLNGARAPWWRPDARIHVTGATATTPPGDLARAVYEGVAHDLRRCLARLPERPRKLSLAGGGADNDVWQQVLMGVTDLPITVTEGGDAAGVGAALLARQAADRSGDFEVVSASGRGVMPKRSLVEAYAELSKQHDAAAKAVIGSLG
jgi:sugar (pentulose or hexulose) kinase